MFRRSSSAVATSREGHRKPGPLWSKAKSSRPAHQFALPLKADKSLHQPGVWQPEHTSEEIQEGGKKRQSRRELSERLDVGRSEMFGGL
jgi:hypothetical protein